jgi:hypothetical protein
LASWPTARARVAHLARIDHRHWQRRGPKRGNERDLAPVGGLHHDQLGLQRLQLRGQVGDTRLVMGAHPLLPTGPHGTVQRGFGDFDPDGREVHVVSKPAATRWAQQTQESQWADLIPRAWAARNEAGDTTSDDVETLVAFIRYTAARYKALGF